MESELSESVVARCELLAPFPGVVSNTLVRQGEWIEKGAGVVKLVRMDRLRVETLIEPYDVPPHELIGAKCQVQVTIGKGKTHTIEDAVIKAVAAEFELDGRYHAWIDFPNQLVSDKNGGQQWLLRPGMFAALEIDLSSPAPQIGIFANTDWNELCGLPGEETEMNWETPPAAE